MAHFAQLDDTSFVLRVVVVSNDDILDANGTESEEIGVRLCQSFFGTEAKWKQTSYNNTFRQIYAGIGFYYDENLDVFINPNH